MNRNIGIACNNPETLRAQVWLSEVTIAQDDRYDSGAVVPSTERWKPTWNEFEPFLATPDTPADGTIELIHHTRALEQYIASRDKELKPVTSQPGQLTTTTDRKSGLLHGLHFDNHFKLPAATRLHSPRRIGHNVGPGDRWLLVGSIDAITLTELLGYPPEHIPNVNDIRHYVADPAHYGSLALRCLWVPIPKLTTYIGPTEMMAHDGSSFAMPLPSTIRFWMTQLKRGQLGSIY